MARRSRFYLLGIGVASIAACGGLAPDGAPDPVNAEPAAAGNGGTGAGTGGSQSTQNTAGSRPLQPTPTRPPAIAIPEKHRALAATCDHERPTGNARPYEVVACPEDGGACEVPEHCPSCRAACVDYADGLGPRCVSGEGECLSDADCTAGDNGRCANNRDIWSCSYDTCYSDSACTSGGPCACEGGSGYAGNTCLPGNCQTDADCGANGYCSPTLGGCGNYGGVIGYFCHTAADKCVDDADCASPTQGLGYCMYSPEVGHWSCGYGQCVG